MPNNSARGTLLFSGEVPGGAPKTKKVMGQKKLFWPITFMSLLPTA